VAARQAHSAWRLRTRGFLNMNQAQTPVAVGAQRHSSALATVLSTGQAVHWLHVPSCFAEGRNVVQYLRHARLPLAQEPSAVAAVGIGELHRHYESIRPWLLSVTRVLLHVVSPAGRVRGFSVRRSWP